MGFHFPFFKKPEKHEKPPITEVRSSEASIDAEFYAAQQTQILVKHAEETMNILRNTNNPAIFFSRLDYLNDFLVERASLGNEVSFEDGSAVSDLEEMQAGGTLRTDAIKAFIKRYGNYTLQKIQELEKPSAKLSHIDTFKKERDDYASYLSMEEKELWGSVALDMVNANEPNADDLLSYKELMKLNYANRNEVEFTYPHYLSDGKASDKKQIKRFVDDGYLAVAPIEVSLKHSTVAELKEFMKSHGVKVTGKKDVLIASIMYGVNSKLVAAAFPTRYYALTNKGKQAVDGHDLSCEAYLHNGNLFASGSNESLIKDNESKKIESAFALIYSGKVKEAIIALNETKINEASDDHIAAIPTFKIDRYASALYNFLSERKEFSVEARASAAISEIIGGRIEALTKHFCPEDFSQNALHKLKRLAHAYVELAGYQEQSQYLKCHYSILTMNDEHTCDVCSSLEGHSFDPQEAIVGKNFPPFDNCTCDFCRCTTTFQMDGAK